ncbi:MAG: hypothetical protein KGR26_17060 [Cyanobacteria bacterium REEB65]|nr:hypothetical protein [Cyanobacteria bacterium REEB65]
MAVASVTNPNSVPPDALASTTLPASANSTLTTAAAAAGTQALGEMDFLKLLTTQLQHQDPTQPMDDTQFVSQLAQFSSLQETQQLNQNFSSFNQSMSDQLDLQTLTQSSGLIGKVVFAGPDSTDVTMGTVTEVRQQNGKLQVVMQTPDGQSQSFDLSQVQQVGATQAQIDGYQPPSPTAAAATGPQLPAGFSPYGATST